MTEKLGDLGYDQEAAYFNQANRELIARRGHNQSRRIKALSSPGNIRCVIVQATPLVTEIAGIHHLKGDAIRAIGETIIAAQLLASYCKPGERVNLNVQGNRRFVQGLADADPDGAVRAYLIERGTPQDKDAPGLWGHGVLSVVRTKIEEGRRPYLGAVPLATGVLEEDFNRYWLESEQVPSSVAIQVQLTPEEDRPVLLAGGILVQTLGGSTESEIALVREKVRELRSRAADILESPDPLARLGEVFNGLNFVELEEKPLMFRCECSLERVIRALLLSGESEVREQIRRDGVVTVNCDFCEHEYHVDEKGLGNP